MARRELFEQLRAAAAKLQKAGVPQQVNTALWQALLAVEGWVREAERQDEIAEGSL